MMLWYNTNINRIYDMHFCFNIRKTYDENLEITITIYIFIKL